MFSHFSSFQNCINIDITYTVGGGAGGQLANITYECLCFGMLFWNTWDGVVLEPLSL